MRSATSMWRSGARFLRRRSADEGHELTDKAVEGVLKKLRLAKPEDVYADVGRGALRADEVLAAVYPQLKRDPKRKRPSYVEPNSKGVSIAGLTEGIGYRLGGCCHPIPGDRIIGLMVPGEGVVIHTIDCEVLDRHQDSMADWIDVRWKDHVGALSVARIMVRLKNETGALATLANVIGQNGANISNLKITSRNPLYFEFQVDVEVGDARASRKSDPRAEGGFRGRSGRTRARARHRQSGAQAPPRIRARHCFPSSARNIDPMNRLRLGVNIDHVATLRNARGSPYPDPLRAARASLAAGADIITAHLREDRRHIRDEDIAAITGGKRSAQSRDGRDRGDARDRAAHEAARLLSRSRAARGSARRNMASMLAGLHNRLAPHVRRLGACVRVSLFIDADPAQIEAARALGVPDIELHTGAYAEAVLKGDKDEIGHRLEALARVRAQRSLARPRGPCGPRPDLRQCRACRRDTRNGGTTNRTLSGGRSGVQRP